MSGFVYVIYLAVTVYAWLIVAQAVMSWMQLRPGPPRTASTRCSPT